jgi:endonuclease/exonuclease/phosphatase family metal-dependent hydrolase
LTDFDSTRPPRTCHKGCVSRRGVALVASLALLVACNGSADLTVDGPSAGGAGGDDPGAGGEAPGGAGAGGGAAGAGAVGGATPVDEATVLTWNVESFPLTAGAIDGAAEVLTDLAPDVVALQEIGDEGAFAELLERLPDYEGILNDDPGAYIRVGLLYRRERVEIEAVETLFPSDWYAFPRPPLKAHVTIAGSEPIDFNVVVLHLKAMLDDESQARRRDACEKLAAWVEDELTANDDEQDFMLLGDLNDKLTDPPEWNVFLPFLDHPDQYAFLTLPLAEAGEHSYIPFESLIDHVLVTADMLDEVGAGGAEVLPLEETVANYDGITDHRPVSTRLVWSR